MIEVAALNPKPGSAETPSNLLRHTEDCVVAGTAGGI